MYPHSSNSNYTIYCPCFLLLVLFGREFYGSRKVMIFILILVYDVFVTCEQTINCHL